MMMVHKITISIHAPTRGATYGYGYVAVFENISIHAPTRGATAITFCTHCFKFYFNPRSYKRSDDSTVRGNILDCDFNPRSYKRSDKKWCDKRKYEDRFQSTLLQEERLVSAGETVLATDFNPRSYKRSDYERKWRLVYLL